MGRKECECIVICVVDRCNIYDNVASDIDGSFVFCLVAKKVCKCMSCWYTQNNYPISDLRHITGSIHRYLPRTIPNTGSGSLVC